jgi:hypothetical protein
MAGGAGPGIRRGRHENKIVSHRGTESTALKERNYKYFFNTEIKSSQYGFVSVYEKHFHLVCQIFLRKRFRSINQGLIYY